MAEFSLQNLSDRARGALLDQLNKVAHGETIESAEIVDGAITAPKLASTLDLADKAITSLKIEVGTPVNAVAANGEIDCGATGPSTTETISAGGKTYTFVTALTTEPATVANEILLEADVDDTLQNLANAINAINDAGQLGTKYSTGTTINANVSAGTVNTTDHKFTVTAKVKGTVGNAIVLTEAATDTTVTGTGTLAGGINGTVGLAKEILVDSSYLYVAIAANTIADANWRRVTLGSAY